MMSQGDSLISRSGRRPRWAPPVSIAVPGEGIESGGARGGGAVDLRLGGHFPWAGGFDVFAVGFVLVFEAPRLGAVGGGGIEREEGEEDVGEDEDAGCHH